MVHTVFQNHIAIFRVSHNHLIFHIDVFSFLDEGIAMEDLRTFLSVHINCNFPLVALDEFLKHRQSKSSPHCKKCCNIFRL